MHKKRFGSRLLAMVALFAVIATACGGGSDDTVSPVDSEVADGADSSQAVVSVVPTTAPLEVEASADESLDDPNAPIPTVDPCIFGQGDDCPETEASVTGPAPAAENETIVLNVRDDVSVVPVFDGPNGNNITLFDVNPITNVETEYPLFATTNFGNRLTLMVDKYDASGAWAEVYVPVRPNGKKVWVQTAFFSEMRHDYRLEIDLSDNQVALYKGDEELIRQLSVDGRESRPTPVVRSYIDEKIAGSSQGAAYGAWILSIAAFSDTLSDFGGAGAMPKLALHGTNRPDLMGQDVSSGCVRVPDEVITFIAETIPAGTPVDIVA